MDLSGIFDDDMLEYPLLDGSKFVDGTYTYSSDTGYPVITNSGGDLGGVVRKNSNYGYSNDLVVSTTTDGHKILTPPDGARGRYDNGCWCYYSMYQRSMTTSIFYRVSFDLRLVNLAGVTLSNVTRAVLGQSDLGSPLNIVVNTATGATLGGVALPDRIMTGDWVHVDLYIWNDGSTHRTLVIDGDLTQATDVSFSLPAYPPNFCFAANALNFSDWPECPHTELGNPSIYILQNPYSTPFVSDTALSVIQSGTESATLGASVSYGDDPAAERYVDSAGWTKCTSAGAVDYVPDVPTYTAAEECDLLYTGTTTCKIIRSGETELANILFCGIHRVQPLEDFMQTSWSTGDSSRTITVTESGTYTVTVTNPGGSVTASVTVAVPTNETDYDRIFRGDPVPEGAWLFGQSNEYRTGIATVQSQYSASPRILALAGMYWDMLNPGSEIQTMLDDMLNPSTARGYGLDVWGRIVGIKRATVPVSGEYLAFDPDPLSNPDGDSWNNAPFNPLTPQGLATDAVFRVYVMVKAMMNIGNGSLADINKYFSLMFPGSGIQVIHAGTMIIRVLDYDAVLTDAAIMALRSIDWVPAGVGWQVWQGEPDCFGFLGSELQPFDQAPFISDSALIFE